MNAAPAAPTETTPDAPTGPTLPPRSYRIRSRPRATADEAHRGEFTVTGMNCGHCVSSAIS